LLGLSQEDQPNHGDVEDLTNHDSGLEQAGGQIRPPIVHCEPATQGQELDHQDRPEHPEGVHAQPTFTCDERQEHREKKGGNNH